MSTIRPNPGFEDGYEIVETDDFLRRVEAILEGIRPVDIDFEQMMQNRARGDLV